MMVLSTHNREISEELHSEKMFTHGRAVQIKPGLTAPDHQISIFGR
jgi:hypothetical protein